MSMKRRPFAYSKPGDFYAVELTLETYGYVRQLAGSWAVLPIVSTNILYDIEVLKKYKPTHYFDGFSPTADPTTVIRVGHLDFERDEDRWAPPRFYKVTITNTYRIVARGRSYSVLENEIEGLEKAIRLTPAKLRNFIIGMKPRFQLIVDH